MMDLTLTLVTIVTIGFAIAGILTAIRLRPVLRGADSSGLIDKIPYRKLVADGIVECDGGRLMVGWQIHGADLASMSYDAQAAIIADATHRVAGALGIDVLQLEWNTFREEVHGYPRADIPPRDPTSATMFAARVRHFERPGRQHANDQYLTLTWTPPAFLVDAIAALVQGGKTGDDERWERSIAQLQDVVERIGDALSNTWRLRRLTRRIVQSPRGPIETDELVDYLRRCFTHDDSPIALPDTALIEGTFGKALSLEGVIADQDVEARFVPRVGEAYFEVVQLETFKRGGTSPEILSHVTNLPMPLRTSVRAILASPEAVATRANKRFQMFNSNSDQRANKRRNFNAEIKAQSAQEVNEDERWWHWNVKVIVAGESVRSARNAARTVKKMMQNCGFGARIERLGNPAALAASWPGNATDDRSESLADTTTILDLAPVGSVYTGPKEHPNPHPSLDYSPPTMRGLQIGNTPIDIYDTVEDVGHCMSIGPIGTGKSTLSNGLVYLDVNTVPDVVHQIYDQGHSAQALTWALGGDFIEADPRDPKTGTCPYDMIEDPGEREIWAQWTLTNLRMGGHIISQQREEYVSKALQLLAKSRLRSTSLLQAKLATFDTDLAAGLTPWTLRGVGGYLFDVEASERIDDGAKLQTFELSRLARYRDDRLIGPLVTLGFNRLLRRQLGSNTRVRVHLDEPKDLFAHPTFVPLIAEYYDKIARKNGGAVRGFTQHPEQFLESEVATSIVSGTRTWFFMPNPQCAANGAMRETYKTKFALHDETCDLIATATPKRHFVLWQDGHAALVNPNWTPEELEIIGATGKDDRLEIGQLRRLYPTTWPMRRFEQRGLTTAAHDWKSFATQMGMDEHENAVA
jgi:type IV secretion system protein VirB4